MDHSHQIGTGDLKINGRLLARHIFGVKNPLCRDFVTGFQTGLFAGDSTLNKKMPLLR
jgi:hypothetical protein